MSRLQCPPIPTSMRNSAVIKSISIRAATHDKSCIHLDGIRSMRSDPLLLSYKSQSQGGISGFYTSYLHGEKCHHCVMSLGSSRSDSAIVGSAVQQRNINGSANGSMFSRFTPSLTCTIVTDYKDSTDSKEKDVCQGQTGTLIDNGMVYRERFVIRCYEVGVNRTASIESIANLMQEIGCNHAQSVGFSNDGFATTPLMREKRLIWVTTRMHIEMERYPVWGDLVEIDTWFQGEGHIKSRRDWIIKMAFTGEVIGRGTSSWVTMNQDTRRLSKVPEDIQAEYMKFCPNPPRFAFDVDPVEKIPTLKVPAESVCSYLRPRRGDLDMNQHVNNVTYIGWMLESVPSEVFDEAELTKLTLEYRREVSRGEMVESLASLEEVEGILDQGGNDSGNGAIAEITESTSSFSIGDEDQYVHLLCLQESRREINRGRTVWRKKNYCNIIH